MDHGTPLPLDGGAARETQALPVLVRSRLPVHQEGEPRPADYLIGQNQHKRTPYVLHKFEGVRPAQAGRSSKLVKNTLLRRALKAELHREQPAYKVMRYRYWKNAHVQELTWSNAKLQKCHKRVERSLTPEERLMNQKRCVVRAKSHLRRDILTIEADRMFTLTYRENMTDRAQGLLDYKRFQDMMRKRFGRRWGSVGVIEYQKRGAVHFHLAVNGFFNVDVLREVWRSVVGQGTVHVEFRKKGRGNVHSKLASYMSKYMAKDLDEGRKPGDHRYLRCQVGDAPCEIYYIPDSSDWTIRMAYELLHEQDPQASIWVQPTAYGGGVALAMQD